MSLAPDFDNDRSTYHEIEEGVENLEQYCPGGLPVVRIGDKLKKGQYTVVHKLGHGATSTIWLALCKAANTVVAIKALTVTATDRSQEATFLSRFSNYTGIRLSLIHI